HGFGEAAVAAGSLVPPGCTRWGAVLMGRVGLLYGGESTPHPRPLSLKGRGGLVGMVWGSQLLPRLGRLGVSQFCIWGGGSIGTPHPRPLSLKGRGGLVGMGPGSQILRCLRLR